MEPGRENVGRVSDPSERLPQRSRQSWRTCCSTLARPLPGRRPQSPHSFLSAISRPPEPTAKPIGRSTVCSVAGRRSIRGEKARSSSLHCACDFCFGYPCAGLETRPTSGRRPCGRGPSFSRRRRARVLRRRAAPARRNRGWRRVRRGACGTARRNSSSARTGLS
jgi:hypothetical protein